MTRFQLPRALPQSLEVKKVENLDINHGFLGMANDLCRVLCRCACLAGLDLVSDLGQSILHFAQIRRHLRIFNAQIIELVVCFSGISTNTVSQSTCSFQLKSDLDILCAGGNQELDIFLSRGQVPLKPLDLTSLRKRLECRPEEALLLCQLALVQDLP